MSLINVNAAPRIQFLGSAGQILDNDEGAVAFALPDHSLQFALAPELVDSHEEGEQHATALRLLDQADWRLPTRKELELLLTTAHTRPATWPELAKHTPTDDWYWTGDRYASDPGNAWGVGFSYGGVDYSLRGSSGFVRAVRSVPPSQ